MTALRKLWRYRFLATVLTWRYIQTRYSRTILGPAWVVLQPLLPTLLLTMVLTRLMPAGSHPYWKQTASAMILWTFFTGIVDRASQSLMINEQLITKVYFPRILLPLGGALACLVDLSITLLLGTLVITGGHVHWQVILMPLYCIPTFTIALSFSLVIGSTMIFVRDLKLIQPFLTQIGLYISPILFPLSTVPAQLQTYMMFNPVTFSILGVQYCLGLGDQPSTEWTLCHSLIALFGLIGAWMWFEYLEREFADQI